MKNIKLRIFETFAGIGAQEKALHNVCKNNKNYQYEIAYISEWDVYSLISKDAIHNKNLSYEETLKYLSANNIGDIWKYLSKKTYSTDGKEPNLKLKSKNEAFLKRLVVADHRTKNLGSILDIKANDIEKEFDLLTYSFPCQDLSVASMGRGKGMKEEDNTRSGLLWEIKRILTELKHKPNYQMPKYLLLENVENMLSSNHIEQYKLWINYLDQKLDYTTFTVKLNARKFKNPQNRTRIFAISINKKYKKTIEYINKLINNFEGVDQNQKLQNYIIKTYGQNRDKWDFEKWDQEIKKNFLRANNEENTLLYIEEWDALLKNTPSRVKMIQECKLLNETIIDKVPTVTTKQDRIPNSGLIKFFNKKEGYLDYRLLTPRETLLLMGFEENDYLRIKNSWLVTNEKIYKQAGNSIVVTVLEAIFKFMYKLEEEANYE
ncbi:DNA (cytosine-5-)-methyltransferase [Candidatus Mycoplasma pogonae]